MEGYLVVIITTNLAFFNGGTIRHYTNQLIISTNIVNTSFFLTVPGSLSEDAKGIFIVEASILLLQRFGLTKELHGLGKRAKQLVW